MRRWLMTGAVVLAVAVVMGVQPRGRTVALGAEQGGSNTTFTVDGVHSSVVYRVKHMGVAYSYGRFDKKEGTFRIDPSDPSSCFVRATVEAASIDSGNEKRDQHLRSADFFSVEEYPEIRFESTSFKPLGDSKYEVNGKLTLHGQTREVTVQLENTGQGQGRQGPVAGVHATLTIKRSEFGMDKMVGPVGDEVDLFISLEGNG